VLATRPGLVQLWDWRAGTPAGAPVETPSEPVGVDVNAQGTRASIVCASGQVILLALPDMRVLHAAQHAGRVVINFLVIDYVRFAPDGESFATWGLGSDICLWSGETGALLHPPLKHKATCHDVRYTPDGQTLFSASTDATVGIWSVATGQARREPLKHTDWVFRLAVSDDGKSLLTASREGMARLWDWSSGTMLTPPLEHPTEVFDVVFSRDGRWVYTSDKDGNVQSWNRSTGMRIGPSWVVPGQAYDLALTPDDRHLIVSGDFASIRVFPVADFAQPDPPSLPTKTMLAWGELLSGQAVHKDGGIVNLTTDEWLDRWQRLRQNPRNATPQ
jgi:WD40 repeat protein